MPPAGLGYTPRASSWRASPTPRRLTPFEAGRVRRAGRLRRLRLLVPAAIVAAYYGLTSPPAASRGRTTTTNSEGSLGFRLRHQRHRAGARRACCASSGPTCTCRCSGHPRALREGEAARGHAHRRLPARHHRDGQPHAHAGRRRRRRGALRQQPAEHAGRRGRGAGQRLRRARLRHQGRGRRDVLRAHQRLRRPPSQHHHGRRRRRHRRAARRAPRHGRRHHRRHRRDHHRRHPPQGARGRGPAHVPHRRRQRGQHQAHVRQPLRHRPEHARRRHPRHQHPDRRQHRVHRRLRLVRPRPRACA